MQVPGEILDNLTTAIPVQKFTTREQTTTNRSELAVPYVKFCIRNVFATSSQKKPVKLST